MANLLENWKWKYVAKVTHIVDGDTFDVEIDRGFRDKSTRRIRLKGIDTEELNDEDEDRSRRAKQARDLLIKEFVDELVIIQTFRVKEEVFGKERTTFNRYEASALRARDGWDPKVALVVAELEKKPR